jgi:hypothetical protein
MALTASLKEQTNIIRMVLVGLAVLLVWGEVRHVEGKKGESSGESQLSSLIINCISKLMQLQ